MTLIERRPIALLCLVSLVCCVSCHDTGSSGGGAGNSDASSMQGDGSVNVADDTGVSGPDENVVLAGARRANSIISAAADSSGKRWIAFYDQTHHELRVASRPSGGAWSETGLFTDDGPGVRRRDLELRLDSKGHPHIGYVVDHEGLFYARHDGSTWQTEKIETSTSGVDEKVELALDSNDKPHLAYSSSTRLMHAEKESGSWKHTEMAEASNIYDTEYRFALSPDGKPYVLYTDDISDDELELATNASGSWTSESVLKQGNSTRHIIIGDVRFDGDGNVTVVYGDRRGVGNSDERLTIATKKKDSWEREAITTRELPARIHGMVRTDKGLGRILYAIYQSSTPGYQALAIARETSNGWKNESLSNSKSLVQEASLAHSSKSGTGVAYIDRRYKNLNWAERNNGKWSSKHLRHAKKRVTFVTGLSVDENGHPHVGYLTGLPDKIRYAARRGDSWKRKPIDTGYLRAQRAIAGPVIDKKGKSNIVYLRQNSRGLKVARGGVGGWSETEIDKKASLQSPPQFLVDGNGQPHLTYGAYDGSSPQFRHAWRAGGSWKKERLQALESMRTTRGQYDMALDSDGELHFVTVGENSKKLYYRTKSKSGWSKQDVTGSWKLQAFDEGLGIDSNGRPHVFFTATGTNVFGMVHATRKKSTWENDVVASQVVSTDTQVRTSSSGKIYAAGEEFGKVTIVESSNDGWTKRPLKFRGSTVNAQSWKMALSPKGELYIAFADKARESLVVTRVAP